MVEGLCGFPYKKGMNNLRQQAQFLISLYFYALLHQ